MNDKMRQQLLAIIGEEANIDVEIDQELYQKPDWGVEQIVRASGLVEDICEHGIGHPNLEYIKKHDPDGELGLGIHGCDLCCFPEEMKRKIKVEKEDQPEPFQELWDENLRKRAMKDYDDRTNTPSIESGRCDKT